MCVCEGLTDRQYTLKQRPAGGVSEWDWPKYIVILYIFIYSYVTVLGWNWPSESLKSWFYINAWLGNSPGWLMVLCSVMSHGSDNITFWHCNLYIYIYVLSCLVSHCFSQFLGLALVGFVQPLRVLENPWVLKTHFQVYSRPLKLVKTRHGAWQSLKIEIALLLWSVLIVTAFSPSLLSQVFMT